MRSNWILNEDGSIYHLKIKPGQLSNTIITVGDPDRVNIISNYLDKIETSVQSREFKIVTGLLSGKRISILSTGIGTGGIDIVMNEIDALFNLDLKTGKSLEKCTPLQFIRLGTTGAIQADIPIDRILISEWSVALDGLMTFYAGTQNSYDLAESIKSEMPGLSTYYVFSADKHLVNHFTNKDVLTGCTLTASGFYAAQGRSTRIKDSGLLMKLKEWEIERIGRISNIEMETSGIYGLSHLMGHSAISLNAILANRITGEFSTQAEKTIKNLIEYALDKISVLA